MGAVLSQTRELRSWTCVRCDGLLSNKERAPLELFGRIGLLDNLPVISIIYRVVASGPAGLQMHTPHSPMKIYTSIAVKTEGEI